MKDFLIKTLHQQCQQRVSLKNCPGIYKPKIKGNTKGVSVPRLIVLNCIASALPRERHAMKTAFVSVVETNRKTKTKYIKQNK